MRDSFHRHRTQHNRLDNVYSNLYHCGGKRKEIEVKHKHKWHICYTFNLKGLQCSCGRYREYEEDLLHTQVEDDIKELKQACRREK